MITFGRIIELRKSFGMFSPVEFPRIHNDAGNGRSMTTNPFSSRMYDDIGAMFDGSKKITSRAEGIVDLNHSTESARSIVHPRCRSHHQGNSSFMSHFGYRLQVRDVVFGIPNALHIDGFGLVINGLEELFGIITVDELGSDPKTWHEHLELVVGATVEIRSGYDVVTRVSKGGDGHKLSRLPGGGGHRGHSTFKSRHALLKHIDGWIHDAAIDVAEFLETKQTSAMSGVIEDEGL